VVLVARPAAVWIATAFGRWSVAERSILSVAGLRGAVPVVLATFPVIAGVENSDDLFNIVFFAVLISTVLQVIVNVLDYKMDVAAAVAAPRLHHQWLPDEVRVESGFPGDVLSELRAMDHRIVEPMGQTSANSILVTPNGSLGAPDPRTRGAEAAGQ